MQALCVTRLNEWHFFSNVWKVQMRVFDNSSTGKPRHLYFFELTSCNLQVFGIVGKPVGHSRSPALHNAAFAAAGIDAVYVPLLVDELRPFLGAFPSFSGFSVTIPHKVQLAQLIPSHKPAVLQCRCRRSI